MATDAEQAFYYHWLHILHGPPLEHDGQYIATRRWRYDYALPQVRFAVEIDGGVVQGKGHATLSRFEADCEKLNLLINVHGWQIWRWTPQMIERDPVRYLTPAIQSALVLLSAELDEQYRRQP